ncbi:MAG: hypothetical protein ACREEE_12790 [Dongiaceae bacterium]
MTTPAGFMGLPVTGADGRAVAAVVNRLNQGKLNCTGSMILAANQATTTLSDPRLTGASVVLFMPKTANAAAEIGAGTLFVTGQSKGAATLNHANNAQTDRQFDYIIIG